MLWRLSPDSPEVKKLTSARAWDDPSTMVSVEAVFERVTSSVAPLTAIEVRLLEARDLFLADDVVAGTDVPPFPNSAMDGYAICAADTHGIGPVEFDLVATIAAGAASTSIVRSGEAARIMTGAPIPAGADAVIRFEEVIVRAGQTVVVARAVEVGENIRLAGEDVRSGQIVLTRGRKLGSSEIGMLAALNVERVGVHRRPRIGILSTGDEVVDLGETLEPGQIRDANGYALAARVAELGGVPVRLGIAADTKRDLSERLRAASGCDLILTSGGVSVGDFDLVKDVLREEGRIDILTVRMKPGKPLAIGEVGGMPFVGLPGNPVAALVSFDQFVRPVILKMLGSRDLILPTIRAELQTTIDNRGHRRHFERGNLSNADGRWIVEPSGIHGSAMLSSLVASNCYIVVDENCSVAEAGSEVEVQVIDAAGSLRSLDHSGAGLI
jgi:molybdopterin molybdotransferase